MESAIEPWAFELIVGGPDVVTMPDGRNIRKVIADIICNVQRYIQDHDEGDTISITSIIHVSISRFIKLLCVIENYRSMTYCCLTNTEAETLRCDGNHII